MTRIRNDDPLVRTLSRFDLFRLQHDCALFGIDYLRRRKRELVRLLASRYRSNVDASEERSNEKYSFDI